MFDCKRSKKRRSESVIRFFLLKSIGIILTVCFVLSSSSVLADNEKTNQHMESEIENDLDEAEPVILPDEEEKPDKKSDKKKKEKEKKEKEKKDKETKKRKEKNKLEEQAKHKNKNKKVYLTFDDGPSNNTDAVLNILDKYNVKATFFVIGRSDTVSKKRYQAIVEKGHTIGLHSYTHKYKQIYANLKAFQKDYKRISDLIYNTTGVRAKYYRFPGGSSNTISPSDMNIFANYLTKEGIKYFDWNVQCGDAVRVPPSPYVLYSNVINPIRKSNEKSFVVLIHDSKPMRNSVKALPMIIEKLQKDGYQILPIDDHTIPIHHKIQKK